MADYFDLRKKLKRHSTPGTATRAGISPPISLSQATLQRAQQSPHRLTSGELLTFQSRMGNRGVQRMLGLPTLSAPGSAPGIQRAGDGATEEDDEQQKEQVDDLVLDMEEANASESEGQGFQLLDDAAETPVGDTTPTRVPDHRSDHYYRRQERMNRPPPPKKTPGQEFKSFKKKVKNMVKGHTVHSYGKHGLHAIMHRDEKLINKAQAALKSDPDKARVLLRQVTPSVKKSVSELNHVGKQVGLALLAPVWFARRQVAHTRWKKVARKVGLVPPDTD